MFFSVLCLLCLCVRLFICAFWSPAGLLAVVSNYAFVTFPLASWVRCGTCLYRFLIFTPLLTLLLLHVLKLESLFSMQPYLKPLSYCLETPLYTGKSPFPD